MVPNNIVHDVSVPLAQTLGEVSIFWQQEWRQHPTQDRDDIAETQSEHQYLSYCVRRDLASIPDDLLGDNRRTSQYCKSTRNDKQNNHDHLLLIRQVVDDNIKIFWWWSDGGRRGVIVVVVLLPRIPRNSSSSIFIYKNNELQYVCQVWSSD
jgi:hypothetical protein